MPGGDQPYEGKKAVWEREGKYWLGSQSEDSKRK